MTGLLLLCLPAAAFVAPRSSLVAPRPLRSSPLRMAAEEPAAPRGFGALLRRLGASAAPALKSASAVVAPGLESLAPASAPRPLLSWANAPYAAGGAFAAYRAYKAFEGVRADQKKLIADYGTKGLVLGRKQSRAQFAAATALYKKKLMYVPRGSELFASGLAAIANKPASAASLAAFRDLLAVYDLGPGPKAAAALEKVLETTATKTSERGKLLFYADRCGLANDALRKLAAEGLDNSLDFLAASQAGLGEQAYVAALKKSASSPPYAADAAAAEALGLAPARAAELLGDLNAPPEVDTREDWRKDLEAAVEAESGPLPDDVDTTDKFAPDGGKDEMMLTCECDECGYTLFIAAGREGKFFGNNYKCPTCGAPKSKFTIDEAPSN